MSSPAAMRAFTSASISAGVSPCGRAVLETIVRVRASSGKSHSNVTPTTSSPAPMANRISVVDGRSDTTRTASRYGGSGLPSGEAEVRGDEMTARVQGPITGGVHGRPFGRPLVDLDALGVDES